MDVAGKVNLFIWHLSATLHPSSSFSVCRSDCRLVYQHRLPKKRSYDSGSCWISDHDHCCIAYISRTTDWIDCHSTVFTILMILGGKFFRLLRFSTAASTLGAVSTAAGAALLIPILPGNLYV